MSQINLPNSANTSAIFTENNFTELIRSFDELTNIFTENISQSDASILTRITQDTTQVESNEPICLKLYEESNSQLIEDDAFTFTPNKDPGIEAYMSIIEMDNFYGWEKYCRECHKYSLPPISAVKDILDGKTNIFDMSVRLILF